MSADEEKNAVTVADDEAYIIDKEHDEKVKKNAKQLAEVIKDPQKAERIRKIIELELSGVIGVLTRPNLMRGLVTNVNRDGTPLIMAGIEKSEFLDGLAKFDISEDVLTFLKDLNLLYNRKAVSAYNCDVRRDDWINSNFEIVTKENKDLKITMELIKGSGEIVHIEGEPRSFLTLIGVTSAVLNDLDLDDAFTEEEVKELEKNIDTLIVALKRKSSDNSE